MFSPLIGLNFKNGTKKLHTSPMRFKFKFQAGFNMKWVSCWVFGSCITQRSPRFIKFLPLCLHLHFLLHVYLYTCNGYSLHNSRSSNNLMPCTTLQPLVFQYLTSTLAQISLVLTCITLEVSIMPFITLQPFVFQHHTSTLARAWKGNFEEYHLIPNFATTRRTCNIH